MSQRIPTHPATGTRLRFDALIAACLVTVLSSCSKPKFFNPKSPIGIQAVSPSSGSRAGGITVTVTGSGFVDGISVQIGGNPCQLVTRSSESSLSCEIPAHRAGSVDVTLQAPDGRSASLPSGFYYTNEGPPLFYQSAGQVQESSGNILRFRGTVGGLSGPEVQTGVRVTAETSVKLLH